MKCYCGDRMLSTMSASAMRFRVEVSSSYRVLSHVSAASFRCLSERGRPCLRVRRHWYSRGVPASGSKPHGPRREGAGAACAEALRLRRHVQAHWSLMAPISRTEVRKSGDSFGNLANSWNFKEMARTSGSVQLPEQTVKNGNQCRTYLARVLCE